MSSIEYCSEVAIDIADWDVDRDGNFWYSYTTSDGGALPVLVALFSQSSVM